MLDEKSKELLKTKWGTGKLSWTKSWRKFWIKFLSKNEWVLIFCVLWRAAFWDYVINVSFTLSSAILLIFGTSKILTTVSFWGFLFIPQLDSHWAAGGSLWFPHLLTTRPGRSGAGSGWPLTSGAEFRVFVDLAWLPPLLITANSNLKFCSLWRIHCNIVGSFICL